MNLKSKFYKLISIFLAQFLMSATSFATVIVAFYNFPPNTIPYEKGGRFMHSALFYEGRWIDAYPYYGVRVAPHPPYPVPSVLLISPNDLKIDWQRITERSHQRFDLIAPWNSRTLTYCSKLIGELLNIPPEPMDFSSAYWNTWRANGINLPQGQPGLSPDDVFIKLRRAGYQIYNGSSK